MTCDSCGIDKTVTLEIECRVWKRTCTWRICRPCKREEEALQDERAQESIKIAERAGV